MATITMDLTELDSIKNEFNQKINKLEEQVTELTNKNKELNDNQKRVILTRNVSVLDIDNLDLNQIVRSIISKLSDNINQCGYVSAYKENLENSLYYALLETGKNHKVKSTCEFINLDDVLKLKEESDDANMVAKLKDLTVQNNKLQMELANINAEHQKEMIEQKELLDQKYKLLEQDFEDFKNNKVKIDINTQIYNLKEENKLLKEKLNKWYIKLLVR